MLRKATVVLLLLGAALLVPSAATASLDYENVIINSHPVAYWRLGEIAGSTAYPTVGDYSGTYRGDPLLGTTGLILNDLNLAPTFDGHYDRVRANGLTSRPASSWSDGYTLEAWVETDTTSQEGHIMAFNTDNGGNGIALFRDEPSDRFKFHDCEGGGCTHVLSETTPVPGETYYVVVTVDASDEGHLYVNGELEASFSSAKRPLSSGKFTIGAEWDCCPTPESFWQGKIDEVAVYDYALSASEVQAHWTAGN